ncbi:MAG: hypothetical protein P9L99_16110 [Candidatus Lernaella stagnicola]|nr:hypothetical protein [Candidatus Lernaella stagnicola]
MKRFMWLILLAALLLAITAACDKSDDEDNNDVSGNDGNDDDDDNDDDNDSSPPPLIGQYEFDLTFEVDFQATLRTKVFGDGTLEGVLVPQKAFDVIGAGTSLLGTGNILSLPEARAHMLALKLQGPAVTGGKCGTQPMSYSVALTARDGNFYYVGGLTAYCGEDTFTGKPARVMRLSGKPKAVD